MSQINSANTRIRKLKKLYSISSEIIRQFGLKYYIRTALEELTKQKGKLFAPDELSSLQKEFSIDYETYLQKQSTHNIESIQQNISKLHKKPKFSFILIIDGHSTLENIKQSLDSISDQFYENFNLYLINLSTKQISTKFSSIKTLNLDIILDLLSGVKLDHSLKANFELDSTFAKSNSSEQPSFAISSPVEGS